MNPAVDNPPLGLPNACDRTLDGISPVPSMRTTIRNWLKPLSLTRVRSTTVDFEVKEVQVAVDTKGLVVPLRATKLALKPEGYRAWKWYEIFVLPDLILDVNEVVIINGARFRIMGTPDFSDFGFAVYEAVDDVTYKP